MFYSDFHEDKNAIVKHESSQKGRNGNLDLLLVLINISLFGEYSCHPVEVAKKRQITVKQP